MNLIFSDSGMKVSKQLICQGLDLSKFEDTPSTREFPYGTREKYRQTWNTFTKAYNIKVGNPPTEDMFYQFFENLFKGGKKSSTLRSMYSHNSMWLVGNFTVKNYQYFHQCIDL